MAQVVAVGSRLLVKYVGEREWHERLVTGLCHDGRYVILTPDEDRYMEAAEDYQDVFILGPRGGLPAAVRKQKRVHPPLHHCVHAGRAEEDLGGGFDDCC